MSLNQRGLYTGVMRDPKTRVKLTEGENNSPEMYGCTVFEGKLTRDIRLFADGTRPNHRQPDRAGDLQAARREVQTSFPSDLLSLGLSGNRKGRKKQEMTKRSR